MPSDNDYQHEYLRDNGFLTKYVTARSGIALIILGFIWLSLVGFTISAGEVYVNFVFNSREFYGGYTIIIIALNLYILLLFFLNFFALIQAASILTERINLLFKGQRDIQDIYPLLRRLKSCFIIISLIWLFIIAIPLVMSIITYLVRH